MELNGEDRIIQALFRELKRDEKLAAPLFAKTWGLADAEFHRRGFSQLRFQLSSNVLRFATAVMVVGLVLAATFLASRYSQLRRQPSRDYAKQEGAAGPRVMSEEPPRSGKFPANRESERPTDLLVAIPRSVRVKKSLVASAQRSVKQNGLSEWQSPTATLLRSGGDELLRFVPQMNESAEEMKKFLLNDLNQTEVL